MFMSRMAVRLSLLFLPRELRLDEVLPGDLELKDVSPS
jgi:hypothetical protein